MNEKYGRAKNLARQLGESNLHKSFSHKVLEKKTLQYMLFSQFPVQDHLHEYLRAVLCCFRLCLRLAKH